MLTLSYEYGKVTPTMKIRLSVMVEDEKDFALKKGNKIKVVDRSKFMGVEYFRVAPHPFITIDISGTKDKNEDSRNPNLRVNVNRMYKHILTGKIKKLISCYTESESLFYYDSSDKGKFGETGVLLKDRNILVVSSCGRNIVQQSLFVWNNADDTFMYWRFIINGNVIGKWHDASSIYTDTSLSDPKYAANSGAVGEKAFLTRESNIDFNEIETAITKPGIYYIDTTTIIDEQILYFSDVSKAWIIYLPIPGTKANSWELHAIYENGTKKVFYGKLNSTSHLFEWIEQFNKIEKTIDDNILTIHTVDFGVNGVYHFPIDVNIQINLGDFSYQLANPLLIVTPSYTSENGWFSIVEIYSTKANDTPYYKKLGISFNHLAEESDANYVIEYN